MKITFSQNRTLRYSDLKKGDVFKFHPDDDYDADLGFERDSVYMVVNSYTGTSVIPDAINLSDGEVFIPDGTLRVIKLDAELVVK